MAASVPIYDIVIPTFTGALRALTTILNKADEHKESHSIDHDTRLVEDMLPLSFQVQSVSNGVKNALKRFVPTLKEASEPWADDEKSMAELHARVEKTIRLMELVKREDMVPDNVIDLPIGRGKTLTMTALKAYVQFSQPNMIFHLTTAYNILRAKGVPIGKMDYIMAFKEE